jgi:hypothetical protein
MSDRVVTDRAERRAIFDAFFARAKGFGSRRGLADYIQERRREQHFPVMRGETYTGCSCGELMCTWQYAIAWMDELVASYEVKVQEFAAETRRHQPAAAVPEAEDGRAMEVARAAWQSSNQFHGTMPRVRRAAFLAGFEAGRRITAPGQAEAGREAALIALMQRLTRVLGTVPTGTRDLVSVLVGPDLAAYTGAVLAAAPARDDERERLAAAWNAGFSAGEDFNRRYRGSMTKPAVPANPYLAAPLPEGQEG